MKSLVAILALTFTLFSNCSSGSRRTVDIEYGKLMVPENRNKSESRNISITYARISKTGGGKKPPIVFLQGGPGGSSLAMVQFFANSPLRRNHDIILFDARGTGRSDAFCKNAGAQFMDLMAQDLTVEGEYKGTLKICDECKEELEDNNVDVAGYNSMENAADIEALRRKLGIDKWILLGGSYGTRLGLTYLREYKAAQAAILMGLFPAEINIYEGFLKGLNTSLENLFVSCENDPVCGDKYPQLRQTFYSVMEDLRANPKAINYQGDDFVINAQDALLLIHQMLYARQTIQQVPAFITSLKNGETGRLSQSIGQTARRLSFINAATYWSVQANEEVQFNRENSIGGQLDTYPHLAPGPAFFSSDQRILEQWHSHRSSERENERIVVETPILIVNGEFDPITPMSNAQGMLEYLPNASLAKFPYDGHTVFNACFFSLVEDFVSGNYKAPDVSCAEKGSLDWR
ncbi:MAG: alpha/beta hydrolase [Cyclobacteriaceae bacterium]